jgi:hypothetical protein
MSQLLIQSFALPFGRQLRAKISFGLPSDAVPLSGLLQPAISHYENFLIGISFLKAAFASEPFCP